MSGTRRGKFDDSAGRVRRAGGMMPRVWVPVAMTRRLGAGGDEGGDVAQLMESGDVDRAVDEDVMRADDADHDGGVMTIACVVTAWLKPIGSVMIS